jgi:hypothetical protein
MVSQSLPCTALCLWLQPLTVPSQPFGVCHLHVHTGLVSLRDLEDQLLEAEPQNTSVFNLDSGFRWVGLLLSQHTQLQGSTVLTGAEHRQQPGDTQHAAAVTMLVHQWVLRYCCLA